MIVELGHYALILAMGVSLIQFVVPIWGAQNKDIRLMKVAEPASYMLLLLISASFLALTWAHVTSDFSVTNVVQNSHTDKPMIYKISGVWANHEGSMLLWVLILVIFAAMVAFFGKNLPETLRANVLGVQASIALAFIMFIIFTSNPFLRELVPPANGNGMNPILQDPAMAFHPPFLYAGYVGFSMAFSFAVAALIEGRVDAAWARWVRPWTLISWMFLTLGISMGSWWAYYELGWGGWWFWDPVENASFMPWLLGTALLHSALVVEKRDSLKVWTVLLAILTFSLSLLGTFLVRSGVLTSVHAFAVDPARGSVILGIMFLFTGGALALFAMRADSLKQGGVFAPISREGALILNNLLLTVACATVLFGTLWPLVTEAFGYQISVGAPYFNMTFGPLMLPLLFAMPFGPLMAWKRGDLVGVAQRLIWVGALALVGVFIALAMHFRGPLLAPLGVGLAFWVIFGAMYEVGYRVKAFKAPWDEVRRRFVNLPKSAFGTMLAHIGMGVTLLGIVGTSAWKEEQVIGMKIGDSTVIAGYKVQFTSLDERLGPNYSEKMGSFKVTKDGADVIMLYPSKRNYHIRAMPTSESGIYNTIAGSDLYLVLGDSLKQEKHAVRIYFNPLVRWIWIGCVIMFFGGMFSLMDRRLRVGAPKRAKNAKSYPDPKSVAAE